MPTESLSSCRSEHGDTADLAQTLFISVIMPVRNEAGFIERTLAQLVAQSYDPERFEVLVIDGQSTDGTPERVAEFAKRHPNVRLYTNPRRLGSAARNVAIRHARGDVVVIVDGHCELEDDRYLAKLASAFDRSGADCIGRPQPLDIPGASPLQRAIAAARSSWLGHHPDSHIYSSQEGFVPAESVAVAYRRSVFELLGPFDERFDACEDVELNHRVDRAGLRCFFAPEAAVHYAPRATLRGLFRQLVRYGRGRVRLWRKHRETFSWGLLPPTLLVAGLIVGLPLSFAANWLAAIYLAALALYVVVVLSGSAAVAFRRRRPELIVRLPLVFAVVHAGSGVGILRELLRPGRSRDCERPA
jgi:succinoglycan biosynthesis protein ExoA